MITHCLKILDVLHSLHTMMEGGRAIGLGLALVDKKITVKDVTLPKGEALVSFINEQKSVITKPGGIVSNIISAYDNLGLQGKSRLLARIGDDEHGILYSFDHLQRLGDLQIDESRPTGMAVTLLDNSGQLVSRERYFGAAAYVSVPKDDIAENNKLFITDTFTAHLSTTNQEVDTLLSSVKMNKGQFALCLGGATAAFDTSNNISRTLTSFRKEPDFVIGNKHEAAFLFNNKPPEEVLSDPYFFPNSRIVIITLGNQGAVARFEDQFIRIPNYAVAADSVVDDTGAGDCYAGVTLKALYTEPYALWTSDHLKIACASGAYAAAMLVQQSETRLSLTQLDKVRNYFINMKADTNQRHTFM